MSRPVYRGQADTDWNLLPGAVHRLKQTYGAEILDDEGELRTRVSNYHREHLILPMEVIDGERMPRLQRLSILQHQGAATGLLDFTESPLVALWFACSEQLDRDGNVFILDIGDPQAAANGRQLEEEDLFRTDRLVYYEPDRSLGARIVAQQSVFLICNPPKVPDWCLETVVVPKEAKEPIVEYLGRAGLSARVLFGDVPGLARANTRHTPLRPEETLTPEQHRDLGNRAYRRERYAEALGHYRQVAAAFPDVAQPQGRIGDTLAALGRSREAVDAYTRAIELAARPPLGAVERFTLQALYYNRGNAHAAVGDHSEAVANFDDALSLGDTLSRNILFNRGNSKYSLERFSEAFEDFKAAWSEREGSDAALAMGNCKIMLGEFARARSSYSEGHRVGEPEGAATHCGNNGKQVQQIVDALGDRNRRISQRGSIVFVEVAACEAASFPFAGNTGNAGNTPVAAAAPGGKGFKGGPGFAVVLGPELPTAVDDTR